LQFADTGVGCITDLMVKEGLINLEFADVRAVMRGMGKAMMGTGEASGEDRARHAAEAAIANPLLDDVSMHGARGLLISIAGGPDLTLYEVDEAASRIREEVDADANIILGAMFDPTLDGTIRVSVVATGTDATMVQAMEPVKVNQSRQPLDVRRHQEAQAQQRALPELESQVEAAVAEAITHDAPDAYEHDGVLVEPYVPAAAVEHHDEPVRRREPPVPTVHVPQRAERPDGQRRLPRTEELPAVARRSLVARETQDGEPRNARALFKRLASNVGFSLKPDGAPGREEGELSAVDDAAARSAIEAGTPRNPQVQPPSEGAAGQLDQHGRASPQPAQKEHLEIPAFLRKHG
jgi:cell division protein FtsZ